uniref:Uncharacterized protein n=1 Tax=Arundo donax TaxID=35708 RepID=A0A0A8YTC8_ARUDO
MVVRLMDVYFKFVFFIMVSMCSLQTYTGGFVLIILIMVLMGNLELDLGDIFCNFFIIA